MSVIGWTKAAAAIGPVSLMIVACTPETQGTASPSSGDAASIVGTWNCGPPEAPGGDLVEIRADGTVTVTPPDGEPGPPMSWSVDGDEGSFDGDPFTVETADRLVFDDGFVCTRADP